MAELVYSARLREDNPSVMSAVRAFLARISVHPWDAAAAEAHARIRILARRQGRSAGASDICPAKNYQLTIFKPSIAKLLIGVGRDHLRNRVHWDEE